MIVYQLRCRCGHGFDAWFRNSDAYDQQRAADLVACPACGGHEVGKAPMAPRIGKGIRGDIAPAAEQPRFEAAPPAAPAVVQSPSDRMRAEHMRAVMTKIVELNKHVAETCDYVGGAFAEEARKVHYGEVPHRDIYGEATPAEAAELQEEGIAVSAIPWVRQRDS
jgi:hypothetical protein